MPFNTPEVADPIARSLRSLARESPDLRDIVRFYEAVLILLRDADLHVEAPPLTPEQVREKLKRGQPILSELDLGLDVDAVRELMIKLLLAIESVSRKNSSLKVRLPWFPTPHHSDSAVSRLRLALEQRRLDIGALLPDIASGNRAAVNCAVEDLGLDSNLIWTLVQNALKPALRDFCRRISALIKDVKWHKVTCFVCGAVAMLGELQENDQARHLRCGACGADWRVPRMQCMYCGNEDHKTQSNIYAKNKADKMRVEACDQCKGYLKVISSFSPTPPEMLAVQDIETLHLDYIAQERGYVRHGL
jgi:hypothetical protein